MLNEQVAALKEISDLLLDSLLPANKPPSGFRWSPTAQFGQGCGQRFAYLGHRFQNGLGEFCDGMKLAYLVRNLAEDLDDGHWIERRTVGGDAGQVKPTSVQGLLEASKEPGDIFMGRVVVKNFVDQPLEGMVVHDGKNAERTIIQFICSNVAREARQRLVKIITGDTCDGPFFPPPRPTSEW